MSITLFELYYMATIANGIMAAVGALLVLRKTLTLKKQNIPWKLNALIVIGLALLSIAIPYKEPAYEPYSSLFASSFLLIISLEKTDRKHMQLLVALLVTDIILILLDIFLIKTKTIFSLYTFAKMMAALFYFTKSYIFKQSYLSFSYSLATILFLAAYAIARISAYNLQWYHTLLYIITSNIGTGLIVTGAWNRNYSVTLGMILSLLLAMLSFYIAIGMTIILCAQPDIITYLSLGGLAGMITYFGFRFAKHAITYRMYISDLMATAMTFIEIHIVSMIVPLVLGPLSSPSMDDFISVMTKMSFVSLGIASLLMAVAFLTAIGKINVARAIEIGYAFATAYVVYFIPGKTVTEFFWNTLPYMISVIIMGVSVSVAIAIKSKRGTISYKTAIGIAVYFSIYCVMLVSEHMWVLIMYIVMPTVGIIIRRVLGKKKKEVSE